MLFVGVVAVNAVAQGALRRFTLWPGIEHPTIRLEGGQSAVLKERRLNVR